MKPKTSPTIGIGYSTNKMVIELEGRLMGMGLKPVRTMMARVAFQALTDMSDEQLKAAYSVEIERREAVREDQRTYLSRMAAKLKENDARHMAELMERARASLVGES